MTWQLALTMRCGAEAPCSPKMKQVRGGVGGLFCPLVDADGGIMDQLAVHSTGHLGFEQAHSADFNQEAPAPLAFNILALLTGMGP